MITERHYKGVDYKISTDVPPIYDAAVKKFGCDFNKGIVFTYGDTVHVKTGKLRDDVEAHETVHVVQQRNYPGGAAAWWDRYLTDPKFVLEQELEAYRAQYKFVKRVYKRHQHFEMLDFYAKCLVRVYDLGIGYMEAMRLIKEE